MEQNRYRVPELLLMPSRIFADTQLTAAEKLTLTALEYLAIGDRTTVKSRELGEILSVNRCTIDSSIRNLAKKGYIFYQVHFKANGDRKKGNKQRVVVIQSLQKSKL